MTHIATTTTLLLEGLREAGDRDAWSEFDRRYRPILQGTAQRLGFQTADAADLAQQAMLTFITAYRAGRYDRTRGRLRHWLVGILRNRAVDLQRLRSRRPEANVESFSRVPEEETVLRCWEEESRAAILSDAVAEFRQTSRTTPKTWRVFELVAQQGQPPGEVAEACGVSVAEVYRIRSRIAKALREIVARRECLYDDVE